jgi:quinohemoprotein ethanol dehydrogenase
MNNRTIGILALAALCAASLAACTERQPTAHSVKDADNSFADVDEQRIANADREPGNWLAGSRTFSQQHYSPLRLIDDGNVKGLGLAWYFDLDTRRGQEATPLVADGVMYFSTAWSKVKALNASDGRLLWEFDPQVPPERAAQACCDAVNRGVALWKDKLYVATLDARLIALDRRTGKPVWQVSTVEDGKPYTITGAPRVAKGKVIIGNAGGDSGLRGYVSAYDAQTGKMAWRFYTVPGDPSQPFENPILASAAKTWSGEWWKTSGGGTAWDSMAYDPDVDLLYVGVGNGGPWDQSVRSPGGGDNLFLASIVALRPDTGEYVWHFQTTPGDVWDFTAVQPLVLAELQIDAQPRKVIMQAPKNGFFYVLDRVTGAFISAKPYVPVNWASGLDANGRPIENPAARYYLTGKPFVARPGIGGGHNWQPMSFHPGTGLVYIPAMESPTVHIPRRQPAEASNVYARSSQTIVRAYLTDEARHLREEVLREQRGYLLAWDPVQQKEVWRVTHAGPFNGGVLSTAGNLVFQGTANGDFVAYRADTGAKLWSLAAHGGIVAAPSTFTVNGEQYVAVLQGWGGGFAMGAGEEALQSGRKRNISRVLVFKLGGSRTLPEPPPFPTLDPPPLNAAPALVASGEMLYQRNCSRCHGGSAVSGGTVPDLRYSAMLASDDAWRTAVLDGALRQNGMLGFKERLSIAESDAIKAYVIARAHQAATQ